MYLLSRDKWKYLHFAARRSFTYSPFHVGLWYTVVLEEKLRKCGLEFKEVKSTTR